MKSREGKDKKQPPKGENKMTKEQKRRMEDLYNECSYLRDSFKANEAVMHKMWALEDAVEILGYRFEFEKIAKCDGIKYPTYKLVRE